MKINNTKKGVPTLDVFSTFFPLYSILNIFGLSSVYRDKGELKHSPLLWKFSIVFFFLILASVGNVFCSYMRICVKPTDGTFTAMVKLFHLVGNFQYVIDIYCVHKYGRQSFIDYIAVYQYIDKSLGRTCYKQIKKSIRKICLYVSMISVIVFFFNFISFFISLGLVILIISALEYVFYFFKILNTLDMVSNATQVKYRLKIIADLLKDYYYHTNYMSDVVQNVACQVFITNKENHLDSLRYAGANKNNIMGLNRSYLLLVKQCNYINTMYGFRILSHNLLFVIDMVIMLNLMIRLIFGSLVIEYSWLPIIATAAGLVSFCTVFHCGVHCCEQSYRQTERITFWSENLLINKQLSPEVRDSLKELKSLVQLKPISFHVLHFYKVEYGNITTIVSAIVTYTIIFLQNVT